MADNKANRGEPDRSRINTTEDYELSYWTKKLGLTRDQLLRLIAQHGNSAAKICAPLSMEKEKIDVGRDLRDKRQGAHDPVTPDEKPIPEWLRRERKGPLDKDTGRRNQ